MPSIAQIDLIETALAKSRAVPSAQAPVENREASQLVGSGSLVRKRRSIAVALPEKDWSDLINFVRGDVDNMPDGDEVADQMTRICNTIRRKIAAASNGAGEPQPPKN